jgi:oligopeptidase B
MEIVKAKKRKKILTAHGHKRTDYYYWLKDRNNPEVIEYLKRENRYTAKVFNEPTKKLQKRLYNEIVKRIPQRDTTVPFLSNGYLYYVRYDEGKDYPVICRKKNGDNVEEVLLDGNKMAEGHAYFAFGDWDISTNNNLIAYTVDTRSRRKYTLYIKNIITGEVYQDIIKNTSGEVVFANDNKTLFYVKKDRTLRADRVYKHTLGTATKKDKPVYKENDTAFEVFIDKTKSEKYILIGSESTLSTEYRFLEADNPNGKLKIFQPRLKNVEYGIDHQENRFLIRTNLNAGNFRLMECPEDNTSAENWREVVPYDKNVFFEDFEVFKNFIAVCERKNGLMNFKIINTVTGKENYIKFDEEDYFAFFDDNYEYDSNILRYGYTSLKTPETVYDYNMQTGEKTLKKRQKVVGGYNPDEYVTERKYFTSRDGVKIPVSIVYKKGMKREGNNPLLLYGYGSYGISIESEFRTSRLSLLDRGFVFAVAHVRGGQELGRDWYENGKLLKKKNSFYDFIDCAEALIKEKYTSKEKLFAMGGSAGGLLVGAAVNFAPQLFKGVVAEVPFVDVVTTMLDETIPLTTGEYDEWGNPNDKTYYDYMLSYSPYDNVKNQNYPAMLVTAGLHDSQVQYWEPAKWVAKLRDMKTGNNPLLLHVNMNYGHSGASGRFKRQKETAMVYAFLITTAGIEN